MSLPSSSQKRLFSAPFLSPLMSKDLSGRQIKKTIGVCPDIQVISGHLEQETVIPCEKQRYLPTKSPKRTLYTFKEPLNTTDQSSNDPGIKHKPKRAKRYLIPPIHQEGKTVSVTSNNTQKTEQHRQVDHGNPILMFGMPDKENRNHIAETIIDKTKLKSPITTHRKSGRRSREVQRI